MDVIPRARNIATAACVSSKLCNRPIAACTLTSKSCTPTEMRLTLMAARLSAFASVIKRGSISMANSASGSMRKW